MGDQSPERVDESEGFSEVSGDFFADSEDLAERSLPQDSNTCRVA